MPKTQPQVLRAETESYLQSINLACPPSPETIEEELVHRIDMIYHTINAGLVSGQRKWTPPTSLEPSQIAMILSHLYPIYTIQTGGANSNDGNNLLAVYSDAEEREGTYVSSDKVLFNLAQRFKFTLTKREFEEILFTLRAQVPERERTVDRDLIAVNNGIFNYRTKKLMPFSPDYVFLTKSKVDYVDNPPLPVIHNPDGTTWDVESWMMEIANDDPQVCHVLWQILGAILRPHVRWNKSAWLYSESGNNGKGTLCALMRNLVGNGSYASIPIADFGKDFLLEPLTRAQAIIVDENDVGQYLDKAANLKAVITNDVIQINRKFKEPIAYQFFGFMVQCLNEMPRVKDKSDSFYRRQLFIPFNKCFTGQERRYIKDDYLARKEVLEYVMWKVLNMDYYVLDEPDVCRNVLEEYKEYNDPIRQFIDEMLPQCVWDFLPFTFLYDLYKSWFRRNSPSGTPVGNKTFIKEMLTIVHSDPSMGWVCPDKSRAIRVGAMMNKPEYLIMQYELNDWKNQLARGNSVDVLCTPIQNGRYRGMYRATVTPPEDEENDSPPTS